MKKSICLFLSVVMLLCVLPLSSGAAEVPAKELPVIVLTGYITVPLYLDYGLETEQDVWPFKASAALDQTKSDLSNVISCTLKFLGGDPVPLATSVAKGGEVILEKMYCDKNGKPLYNVGTYPNDPAITNYNYLVENREENLYEQQLCSELAGEIGGENVFVFQYDYRLGAYDLANTLKQYVDDVKSYTGSEKVNLFGLSYGGFIVGTYISLYGDGNVKNAVMSVPALGGTSFAADLLTADTKIAFSDLVSLVEVALGLESDIFGFMRDLDMTTINKMASAFLTEINELPLYWGSAWDLMRNEDYARLKGELLDANDSAELLRKSDIIHNTVMPNYVENFARCKESGMNISILCSTGSDTAFGSDTVADLLLDADKVSGAVCSKRDVRFPDGYTPVCTMCTNSEHCHVSPAMQIDASGAYLPENTWFIDGQYHGMYPFESYSFSLIKKLLLTDTEIDVHTLDEYPQFEITGHPLFGIHASFDKSDTGYLSQDDTSLVVRNLSSKRSVIIRSVSCDGFDIDFDLSGSKIIKKGDSASFAVIGDIPAGSYKHATVTVKYMSVGSLKTNERTFDIMLRG